MITERCGSWQNLGLQLGYSLADLQDIQAEFNLRFQLNDDIARLSILLKFLSLYENKNGGMREKLAHLAVILKKFNCDDLSVGKIV